MAASVMRLHNLPVAMRLRGTPVPIPNTMVKTQAADGTTLETAWESRRPPANLLRFFHRYGILSRSEFRMAEKASMYLEN